MIKFNPAEPFPLLELGTYTHVEAQGHSAEVDAWLGLRTQEIEEELSRVGCRDRCPGTHGEKQNLWIGLAVQNLLSPYSEIRRILDFLEPQPGETVVDLGAAYGRVGFVVGRHYPEVNFVGYEYVGERVKETRRCMNRFHYPRFKMEQADLTAREFFPVPAQYYFIYDYGTMGAIEKTLHDLKRTSESVPITLIASGRLCHEAVEWRHPWLKADTSWDSQSLYTIFRS